MNIHAEKSHTTQPPFLLQNGIKENPNPFITEIVTMSPRLGMEFITERIPREFFKEGLKPQAHGIGVIIAPHRMEHPRYRFSFGNDIARIQQYVMLGFPAKSSGVFYPEVHHIHAHLSRSPRRRRTTSRQRPQVFQWDNATCRDHTNGSILFGTAHPKEIAPLPPKEKQQSMCPSRLWLMHGNCV